MLIVYCKLIWKDNSGNSFSFRPLTLTVFHCFCLGLSVLNAQVADGRGRVVRRVEASTVSRTRQIVSSWKCFCQYLFNYFNFSLDALIIHLDSETILYFSVGVRHLFLDLTPVGLFILLWNLFCFSQVLGSPYLGEILSNF